MALVYHSKYKADPYHVPEASTEPYYAVGTLFRPKHPADPKIQNPKPGSGYDYAGRANRFSTAFTLSQRSDLR
jgi:hypothetical protein